MNIQMILGCALIACAGVGCSSMENDMAPEPSPTATHADGPPVDQSAPITGGQLFNGNY